MSWLSRVVNVFRQERVTDELDEELQFHVESRARDLIADGLAPDEAYREARRRLGNAGVIRERSREVKLVAGLDALMRDMRFAIRMLRRDLVVSLAAIASLALAIGGCTAAFALVDALILRPLPVRDPATLVSVGVLEGGDRDRTSFNYPLFTRLVEAARGRVELAAFSYQSPSLATFDATGGEERVHEQFVSGNGFGMLGVTPALGRVIVPSDDDLAGGRAVAVLSHGFWTRRFGRDPRVIGRTFTLGRKTYQIVGVAREGFTGIEPGISTSLWMPLTSTPERSSLSLSDPGWHWFKVMGRLAPGHRADEGRVAMQAVLTNFRRERMSMRGDAPRAERERYLGARLVVRSASNGISGLRVDYERPLWILAAVVTLVLLLACSNLANLMLARAAAREREMALRLSIGAGRARLVQQMLVEAGAVAITAAAVGAAFARVAAPAIVALLAPSDTPAYLDVHFDTRVLAFAAGVAAVATIAFGLIPALRASGTSPLEALKASSGRHTTRARLLPAARRDAARLQPHGALPRDPSARVVCPARARRPRLRGRRRDPHQHGAGAACREPARPRHRVDAGRPGAIAPGCDLRRHVEVAAVQRRGMERHGAGERAAPQRRRRVVPRNLARVHGDACGSGSSPAAT